MLGLWSEFPSIEKSDDFTEHDQENEAAHTFVLKHITFTF